MLLYVIAVYAVKNLKLINPSLASIQLVETSFCWVKLYHGTSKSLPVLKWQGAAAFTSFHKLAVIPQFVHGIGVGSLMFELAGPSLSFSFIINVRVVILVKS